MVRKLQFCNFAPGNRLESKADAWYFGRCRPFAALQRREYERAVSARKRSSVEGVGCAKTERPVTDEIASASTRILRTSETLSRRTINLRRFGSIKGTHSHARGLARNARIWIVSASPWDSLQAAPLIALLACRCSASWDRWGGVARLSDDLIPQFLRAAPGPVEIIEED